MHAYMQRVTAVWDLLFKAMSEVRLLHTPPLRKTMMLIDDLLQDV